MKKNSEEKEGQLFPNQNTDQAKGNKAEKWKKKIKLRYATEKEQACLVSVKQTRREGTYREDTTVAQEENPSSISFHISKIFMYHKS